MFVPIHTRHSAIEPTPEEIALVHDLQKKGIRGDELATALAGRGVPAERARLLAVLAGPHTAVDIARRIALRVAVGSFAVGFGFGERPLKRWLAEHYPGTEGLVGFLFPLILVLTVIMFLLRRRHSSADPTQTVTRADKIENKPIG